MKTEVKYNHPESKKRMGFMVSISNTTEKPWKTISKEEAGEIKDYIQDVERLFSMWKTRIQKMLDERTYTP